MEPEKKTAQTEAEQTAPAEEKAPAAPEKEEKAAEKKSKKPKKNKEVEALEEQLAGCRQENSDLNDRLLRLRAEYDNFRKRSTKEKEGMFTDGVASALSQVVVVLDNLERAVDACQEDSDLKTGVEMTLKQFREVLEKMGVSEINPVGESFDAQPVSYTHLLPTSRWILCWACPARARRAWKGWRTLSAGRRPSTSRPTS